VFGNNDYGQLGLGDFITRKTPVLSSLNNVSLVSCGYYHSVAISNGTLFTWGDNTFSQLGSGNNITVSNTPISLNINGSIGYISAGANRTFITINNSTYCNGQNDNGECGISKLGKINTPQMINSNVSFVNIKTCDSHTVALSNEKGLYTFGLNDFGQLGQGQLSNTSIPTKISVNTTFNLISCGYRFSLAITNTNDLYGFGTNQNDNIGINNNTNFNTPQYVFNIPSLINSNGTDMPNITLSSGYAHSLFYVSKIPQSAPSSPINPGTSTNTNPSTSTTKPSTSSNKFPSLSNRNQLSLFMIIIFMILFN
jgi:alpha-tubulin suppressor-like RCC1 family protein